MYRLFLALAALSLLTEGLAGAADHPAPADVQARIPDGFPQPMVFKSYAGLRGADFEKAMADSEQFPFIHAPIALPNTLALVRQRFPDKVFTLQGAWGGIGEDQFGQVWPGHCLHKPGTLLASDCRPGESALTVENPERLAAKQREVDSANRKFPFALIVYALDEHGQPDWSRAEHVVLTGIAGNRLTVKRAHWGSKALAFAAGKAVVASHMMFWTRQWQLNLSAHCPRGGPDNLTASEWYARDKAAEVQALKADGIEFDVGRWTWGFPEIHPMDCDNDRLADYGYVAGVNSFGVGGQVFLRELRRLLGPGKIIQADSNNAIVGVRGWRYLSGVQLECFPGEDDYDRFSECFLHLRLWCENAEALPRVSYGLTKVATTTFGGRRAPDGSSLDWKFRVGLASDCLLGMPHPFLLLGSTDFDPMNDVNQTNSELPGVRHWDEYFGGDLHNWRWLGQPLGSMKADTGDTEHTDLLRRAEWEWQADEGYAATCSHEGGVWRANVTRTPDKVIPMTLWYGVRLTTRSPLGPLTTGKDYTLEFEARGDDTWTCAGQTFDRVPRMVVIRGITQRPDRKPISVLVDSQWRTYRLDLTVSAQAPPTLTFGCSEQIGTTQVRNIRLYPGGCERWWRDFEGGKVLLNMTRQPWKADVGPGYRRLKGTQCPEVNTGEPVNGASDEAGVVEVPVWDAAFLAQQGARP